MGHILISYLISDLNPITLAFGVYFSEQLRSEIQIQVRIQPKSDLHIISFNIKQIKI